MSDILDSCKDWKIALLNFTGPNLNPLEYATASLAGLGDGGGQQLKDIFKTDTTIAEYLKNKVFTDAEADAEAEAKAEQKVNRIKTKYDIKPILEAYYKEMWKANNKSPSPKDYIYEKLVKANTFLDLPMEVLGRILVKEKSVGGFDKFAPKRAQNPFFKPKATQDTIYDYYFPEMSGKKLPETSWEFEVYDDPDLELFEINKKQKNPQIAQLGAVDFFRNYIPLNPKNGEPVLNPNRTKMEYRQQDMEAKDIMKLGRTLLFLFDVIINKLLTELDLKKYVGDIYFSQEIPRMRWELIAKFIELNSVDVMFLTECSGDPNNILGRADPFPDHTIVGDTSAKLYNAIIVKKKLSGEEEDIKDMSNSLGLHEELNIFKEVPCIVKVGPSTNPITLISIHMSGKAKAKQNEKVLKAIATGSCSFKAKGYKNFIYGVDANFPLSTVKEILPDNVSLIYPTKPRELQGPTNNSGRTVFQVQLDKSPVRNFPGELVPEPDSGQKDYIISNLKCLKPDERAKGGSYVFASKSFPQEKKINITGKVGPFNKSSPPLIPIWKSKYELFHPFDHALVTNFSPVMEVFGPDHRERQREAMRRQRERTYADVLKKNIKNGGRRKRTRKKLHHRKKKYSLKKHKHIKKRTRRRKTTHGKKRTRRRKK